MKRSTVIRSLLLVSFFASVPDLRAQYQQQATDPVLIAKAKVLSKEVFRDCPVYTEDAYMPIYVGTLARIEISNQVVHTGEGYPLLSGVKLVANKCNPALSRDLNFDPATFNPLKYRFDFSSPVVKKYRVDNTSYIISVLPQQ